MIGIVNYGVGNIKALVNQYEILNIKHIVINEKEQFNKVEKIILPGVGSFDYCKTQLENSKLIDALNENVCVLNKPVLGICVGMQLMADHSEEGKKKGLSWIPGYVKKFKKEWFIKKPTIPHMGWNNIKVVKNSDLLKGIKNNIGFYFVHCYYFEAINSNNVLCTTEYGIEFHSGISRNNIFGIQFHPEKSHTNGLNLLKNFAKL